MVNRSGPANVSPIAAPDSVLLTGTDPKAGGVASGLLSQDLKRRVRRDAAVRQ